jgi:O-antigen biosynthesis protein
MPIVSVIIPTRNRAPLLRRAVQSAIAQDLSDIEILVVDDGSADETRGLNFGDARVRTIRLCETTGSNRARNAGVEQARAGLIAFLDDDDTWEPTKLARQVAAMDDPHVDLCYTARNKKRPDGKGRPVYVYKSPRYPEDHYRSIMFDSYVGVTSSVMISARGLGRTGGFDCSLPALQDYDLYIRILEGGRSCGIADPLTNYTVGGGGENISTSRARFLEAARILHRKYRGSKHYNLLARRLRIISLKKALSSRKYLFETLRSVYQDSRFVDH